MTPAPLHPPEPPSGATLGSSPLGPLGLGVLGLLILVAPYIRPEVAKLLRVLADFLDKTPV